jgi:3'-phosphoadenosine 5'-phosphosulfate sulfotransferase (PAPS reductase)/FAD synthetase
MSLEDKVSAANEAIDRVRRAYRRPAFMCSFGKDSMVLLHLLEARKIRLPVVFHRDPWWPWKYAFADRMIRQFNLEVHDWAPTAMTLWEANGQVNFVSHYQIGRLPEGVLQLPKNILPPEPGRKYLCGLKDVLQRPTGSFNYPWDCVLVGHKSSDEDPLAGRLTLHRDLKLTGGRGPDAAFPMRTWTDEDVWDYTAAHQVPQQEDRYDVTLRREFPDKRRNSDFAHVCIACCDRRETRPSVHCPKLNCEVSTVPVPYATPPASYYGQTEPA